MEMNFNIDVTRLHASKSSSIGTIEGFPKLFADPQTRFGKWDKMYFLYESIPSCQCSAILFPLVIVGIKKKMNLLTPALILALSNSSFVFMIYGIAKTKTIQGPK